MSNAQTNPESPNQTELAYEALSYDRFFNDIAEPKHIEVSTLAPRVKIISQLGESLAVRDEQDVRQELKAIVRNGNFGFGLIGAEGKDMPAGTFLFLAQLCMYPHERQRPEIIGSVPVNSEVTLGKEGTKTEYMRKDGRQIALKIDEDDQLLLQSLPRLDRLRSVFQLITTDLPLDLQASEDLLKQQDYVWAPAPEKVRKYAVAVNENRSERERLPIATSAPQTKEQRAKKKRFKPDKESRVSARVRQHRRECARRLGNSIVIKEIKEIADQNPGLLFLK